jgi:hypothetical protein
MEAMEIMKTLRKWWVLSAALLVLTIIATLAAFVKLPWTYTSTANITFLPSSNLAKAYGGNPYLAFSSTINETADVIRYESTDMRTAQSLAAKGYTAGYTVTDAVDTAAPVLLVTVTGSKNGTVENTLTGVMDEISSLLAQQQASYTPANRIHDQVITFSQKPTRVVSKKARPLIAVLAVGILFTIAIPVIADAALARRNRKKSRTGSYPVPAESTQAEGHSMPRNGYGTQYSESADQQSANQPVTGYPSRRLDQSHDYDNQRASYDDERASRGYPRGGH